MSSSVCISLSQLAQALPTARGHLLSVFSPRTVLTLAASHLSPPGSPRVSSLGAALSGSLEIGPAHSPRGRGRGDIAGIVFMGRPHPPVHGQRASLPLSSHRPGILSHFCTTPFSFCTGSPGGATHCLHVMLEDTCLVLTFRGLHPPERCQL